MNVEVMLDLETLSLSKRAVVLSIGAVKFDPATGDVVDEFYRTLMVDQQTRAGRDISYSTIKFWMDQDQAAKDAAFAQERVPVEIAVSDFYQWARPSKVTTHGGAIWPRSSSKVRYWANSPQFDAVIWETLCQDFGLDRMVPWSYRQLADVRTVINESGLRVDEHQPVIPGVPHHPVYDCRFQVSTVTAARKLLGRFPST